MVRLELGREIGGSPSGELDILELQPGFQIFRINDRESLSFFCMNLRG
jgi:hypothetical protein